MVRETTASEKWRLYGNSRIVPSDHAARGAWMIVDGDGRPWSYRSRYDQAVALLRELQGFPDDPDAGPDESFDSDGWQSDEDWAYWSASCRIREEEDPWDGLDVLEARMTERMEQDEREARSSWAGHPFGPEFDRFGST